MSGTLHICIANVHFQCPYCGAEYNDENDKYLKRIAKNQLNYTTIRCNCNQRFGMTYDHIGNAVAFKMEKTNETHN